MGSEDKGTRRHSHILVLKNGLLLGFNSGLKTAAVPAEHWEVGSVSAWTTRASLSTLKGSLVADASRVLTGKPLQCQSGCFWATVCQTRLPSAPAPWARLDFGTPPEQRCSASTVLGEGAVDPDPVVLWVEAGCRGHKWKSLAQLAKSEVLLHKLAKSGKC